MNINKQKAVILSVLAIFFMPFLISADVKNQNSAYVSIPTYIHLGSTDITSNGSVTMLQNYLKSKNYFNLNATGYFGNITLASVKKFQLDNGIITTGYVGPLTIAKIKALSPATVSMVTNTPPQATLASASITTTTTRRSGGGGGGSPSSDSSTNTTTTDTTIIATSTEEVSTTTSVTLLSPNGGETFTAGDIMTINWISKNLPQNSFIQLSLINPDPNSYNYVIVSDIASSTNSHSWKIPTNILAANYKVRIYCGIYNQESGCGDEETDESDSIFTINATTAENHAPVMTLDPVAKGAGTADPIKFHWNMADSDGDVLAWKFETSRGSTANPCPNPNQSTTNEITHYETFLEPGVHNVLITVDDCRGGVATTSAIVSVSTENNHELSILNPVGGEDLVRGRKHSVAWNTQNYNTDALVDIYLGNGNWNEKTLLIEGVPNTGIATVVIPNSAPLNDLYVIEVDVTNGTFTSGDKTDSYISIVDSSTTPYITLLSPNGNESLKVGDEINITWDTDLASTTDIYLQLEDIRYEGDIASHYSPVAGYATSIPNTGSYSWIIPESLGNGYMKLDGGNVYKLLVANYGNGEIYDESNNLFSIGTSTDKTIDVDLTSTCPTTHFDTDRTIGSTGNDVAALQNFLKAKGFGAATTGYFGSNTRSSLAAYQVSKGIASADGYFGALTRASLNSDCNQITIIEKVPVITMVSPNVNEVINLSEDGSFNIPISWTANYTVKYPWVYLMDSHEYNTPAVASISLAEDMTSWSGSLNESSIINKPSIINPGIYYIKMCDQGSDIINPTCGISSDFNIATSTTTSVTTTLTQSKVSITSDITSTVSEIVVASTTSSTLNTDTLNLTIVSESDNLTNVDIVMVDDTITSNPTNVDTDILIIDEKIEILNEEINSEVVID